MPTTTTRIHRNVNGEMCVYVWGQRRKINSHFYVESFIMWMFADDTGEIGKLFNLWPCLPFLLHLICFANSIRKVGHVHKLSKKKDTYTRNNDYFLFLFFFSNYAKQSTFSSPSLSLSLIRPKELYVKNRWAKKKFNIIETENVMLRKKKRKA